MSKIYFPMIFLIKVLIGSCQINDTCKKPFEKYVTFVNIGNSKSQIFIHNFNKFTDIRSKCDLIRLKAINTEIYIIPKHRIVLDESLQLEQTILRHETVHIVLSKVKGLEFYEGNKVSFFSCCLSLDASSLDIYFGRSLLTRNQCSESVFQNMTSFIQPYWSLTLRSVLFPTSGLCKSVFKSSSAEEILFGKISDSFLIKNRLFFIGTSKAPLANLKQLGLLMFYERLTSALFDSNLFFKCERFYITGVVSIESGLFKHFIYLKYIDIVTSTVENFFHTDSNWLKDLNFYVNVNLENEKDIARNIDKFMAIRFTNFREFITFFSIYKYPNEVYSKTFLTLI